MGVLRVERCGGGVGEADGVGDLVVVVRVLHTVAVVYSVG